MILSGPSCVGKTPLVRALARFFPDRWATLQPLVLYNSRPPRPGETDGIEHRFRPRAEIEALRADDRYAVVDVRGDLQALDFQELGAILAARDALYEGNPYVAQLLLAHPRLKGVRRTSIFLSPLSKDEILCLRNEAGVPVRWVVTELMRRKLIRRARRQKGKLSPDDRQDIDRRAARAYDEMRMAHRFDHVLVNHDGEDSDHWETFPCPLGDARRTLGAVALLLAGTIPDAIEHWDADLLPD